MVEFHPVKVFVAEYEVGDYFGQFLAYVTLTPIYAVISIIILMFVTREMWMICYVGGGVICEMLNLFLKKTIKQPRPQIHGSEYLRSIMNHSYGMPSDHSQMTTYIAMFLIFTMVSRWKRNNRKFKIYLKIFALKFWIVLVMLSRTYQSYHTVLQVIFGYGLGLIFSISYFYFVNNYVLRTRLSSFICHSTIGRFLELKDPIKTA
ncbi:hypothetical protein SNEBB_002891 [Seison nebaliae]|nr:hypothetical protein SNEBB_002891 [Seison nebaliae]